MPDTTFVANPIYRIQNLYNGSFLTCKNGGKELVAFQKNNNSNQDDQRWILINFGSSDNIFKLINKKNGYCIACDNGGDNLIVCKRNDEWDDQLWRFDYRYEFEQTVLNIRYTKNEKEIKNEGICQRFWNTNIVSNSDAEIEQNIH